MKREGGGETETESWCVNDLIYVIYRIKMIYNLAERQRKRKDWERLNEHIANQKYLTQYTHDIKII